MEVLYFIVCHSLPTSLSASTSHSPLTGWTTFPTACWPCHDPNSHPAFSCGTTPSDQPVQWSPQWTKIAQTCKYTYSFKVDLNGIGCILVHHSNRLTYQSSGLWSKTQLPRGLIFPATFSFFGPELCPEFQVPGSLPYYFTVLETNKQTNKTRRWTIFTVWICK